MTPFLIFIIVVAILAVVLAVFLSIIKGDKGEEGERTVSKILNELAEKYGGKVIDDLMIVGDNGQSSQIDHVYISPYGVFVVETKAYSGNVYGSENSEQWTQYLRHSRVENTFYNPIK